MDGILVLLILGIIFPAPEGLEYDDRLLCSTGLTPKIEQNNHYVWCKKGQICSTTSVRFGTAQEYSLGCNSIQNCASGLAPDEIRSLITMADNSSTTCCDTMGCNGIKAPKGFSLCMSCPYQLGHPGGCATVKMCDPHHQCFYQKVFAGSTSQILHEMRCEPDKVCNAVDRDTAVMPPLVGRSVESTLTMMKQCCKGDLCNLRYGLEQNQLISNTSWESHHWQTTTAKTEPSTTVSPSTSVTTDLPTTKYVPTTDKPTTDVPITTNVPTTNVPSSTKDLPSSTVTPSTAPTTNKPSGHTCYARSPGGDETTIQCHAHEPYCLSHVVNYADGQREDIKGCTGKSHCISFFHMDSDKCAGLSNDTTLYEDLTCSFCCTEDLCNSGLVPPLDTLFREPTTTPLPTTTTTSPSTTPTVPPTTTIMTTTTTTLPTTTKQPKPSQVNCYTCSNCGIHRARLYTCGGNSPFCMTEFSNAADGYRTYTKRCASANECELLWYQKSSKRNECANFEPNNMYYSAFNCHFCCIEDGCNLASKPQKHTLYIP